MASLMAAPSGGDASPRAKSSPTTTPGPKNSRSGRKERDPKPRTEDDEAIPGRGGEIIRFNMSWAGIADLTIIVTDRSNEAALLASRCWLRKWDRTETLFKDVVVYSSPSDWEPDDFLC